MKRILSSFFIFLIFICSAQNEEAIYMQQEHDRLARVSNHEIAIQGYIDQNIATYTLPFTITNRINTQKREDGSNFTQAELNEALLNAKKQELRIHYFNQNPSIVNDYIANALTAATTCVNNGFEDGTTASFSYLSQTFNEPYWKIFENFPTNLPIPTPTDETGIISLISGSDTLDPLTENKLKRVKSGNHSIRLNNHSDGNYDISMMRREIVIGQNQDDITFNYALVLQDPQGGGSHSTLIDNPYYQCRLITPNGTKININTIVADRNNTTVFQKTLDGSIVFTDWVCESIDVSQFRGQTVIVEEILGDCGKSGHWGYGYFDNFCGTNCSAPIFGKVTLDPMGITCPLLPLTVSGSFITPAGYEFESLKLKAVEIGANTVLNDVTMGQYSVFGNEFTFTVTGQNLFLNGTTSKKFDFYVKAKFKQIGVADSYKEIDSQSANEGPDVIFNTGCVICNACTPFVSYPKTIYKGNAVCIGGRLRLLQQSQILLYGAVPGNDLTDGEILYTNTNLTIPYTGTETQGYLRDSSGNIFYVSPYDGTLVIRDSNCEDL